MNHLCGVHLRSMPWHPARSQFPFAPLCQINTLQPPIAPDITLCAPVGACTLYCLNESKSGLQLCSTFHSTVSACIAILHALLPSLLVCCHNTASCSSVTCSADQQCQSAWMRSANGAAALQTPHRFGSLPLRALLLKAGQTANWSTACHATAAECCAGSGIKVRPRQGNAAGADRIQSGQPCDHKKAIMSLS